MSDASTTVYLEYVDDASSKFWSMRVDGDTTHGNWGKLGTKGQTQEKQHKSNAEATKFMTKQTASKTKKGYSLKASPAAAGAVSGTDDDSKNAKKTKRKAEDDKGGKNKKSNSKTTSKNNKLNNKTVIKLLKPFLHGMIDMHSEQDAQVIQAVTRVLPSSVDSSDYDACVHEVFGQYVQDSDDEDDDAEHNESWLSSKVIDGDMDSLDSDSIQNVINGTLSEDACIDGCDDEDCEDESSDNYKELLRRKREILSLMLSRSCNNTLYSYAIPQEWDDGYVLHFYLGDAVLTDEGEFLCLQAEDIAMT
jgi:predicted DNA-binding WGR domain protein